MSDPITVELFFRSSFDPALPESDRFKGVRLLSYGGFQVLVNTMLESLCFEDLNPQCLSLFLTKMPAKKACKHFHPCRNVNTDSPNHAMR